jgi:hypothetical protein
MLRNSSPSSFLLVPIALVAPTKNFVLHRSLRLQVLEIASKISQAVRQTPLD